LKEKEALLPKRSLFDCCASFCRSLIYIFKENREGNEEGNTEQILNTFDVCVVINQSMLNLPQYCGVEVNSL